MDKLMDDYQYLLQIMYIVLIGFTLIGFKPKSKLKLQHYVKPSNFIFPDDTVSNVYLYLCN